MTKKKQKTVCKLLQDQAANSHKHNGVTFNIVLFSIVISLWLPVHTV